MRKSLLPFEVQEAAAAKKFEQEFEAWRTSLTEYMKLRSELSQPR